MAACALPLGVGDSDNYEKQIEGAVEGTSPCSRKLSSSEGGLGVVHVVRVLTAGGLLGRGVGGGGIVCVCGPRNDTACNFGAVALVVHADLNAHKGGRPKERCGRCLVCQK